MNLLLSYEAITHIVIMSGILLLMPGPTNTLLFFSGATSGWLKTQKLILAEMLGYFIAISFWGYMIYVLSTQMPGLITIVKVASAIYIFYLSRKIWLFQQGDIDSARIKAINVFFTTLCNPKALIIATYILPHETFSNVSIYSLSMAIFFITLIPVSAIWCSAGTFIHLQGEKSVILTSPLFYRLASIVLCGFSASILYNTFSVL